MDGKVTLAENAFQNMEAYAAKTKVSEQAKAKDHQDNKFTRVGVLKLHGIFNTLRTRHVSMPEPDLPLQSEDALKKMVDSMFGKLSKMRVLRKDLHTNYKGDLVNRPAYLD